MCKFGKYFFYAAILSAPIQRKSGAASLMHGTIVRDPAVTHANVENPARRFTYTRTHIYIHTYTQTYAHDNGVREREEKKPGREDSRMLVRRN